MDAPKDRVEVYKGEDAEWRWHRRASNGQIIADSGEGYKNKQHAVQMAMRINVAADVKFVIQED